MIRPASFGPISDSASSSARAHPVQVDLPHRPVHGSLGWHPRRYRTACRPPAPPVADGQDRAVLIGVQQRDAPPATPAGLDYWVPSGQGRPALAQIRSRSARAPWALSRIVWVM